MMKKRISCHFGIQSSPTSCNSDTKKTSMKPSDRRQLRHSNVGEPRQESLSGNSKTVLIAALSPAFSNLEETLGTLKFARSIVASLTSCLLPSFAASKNARFEIDHCRLCRLEMLRPRLARRWRPKRCATRQIAEALWRISLRRSPGAPKTRAARVASLLRS